MLSVRPPDVEESSVDHRVSTHCFLTRTLLLTYPGVITLPGSTLVFLADLLQAHRDRLRTWRKLCPWEQALLVLAHLHNGDTYERLAEGFRIGVAAAFRYVREAVELLAEVGRSLTAALWMLAWTDNNFAIFDGTVVRTTRIRAHNRLYYSGKHKHHGVNRQGLTGPDGRLIWISDGLPGSPHDITAAGHHNVFGLVTCAQLYLFVDKGYIGGESDMLLVPYKGRDLPERYQDANRAHAKIRANGERGFATLKNWHIFDRFRGCPRKVGPFAQAVFVLENEGR